MLEQVLMEIHNWLQVGIFPGEYTILDGQFTPSFLQPGQYYRIVGSAFNDGLHKCGDTGLTDETFTGSVWALAIPKAIITLSDEIKAWQDRYGESVASPYLAESFGGYSYSKGTPGGQSGATNWQSAFSAQLKPYRKLREI